MRRQLAYLFRAAAWLVTLPTLLTPATAGEPKRPNFVILFADDLGYGDLSCYGHPTIRTPQLDRMAAEGIRFTQFYSAAPVCTPSRAALLTGRYPVRSGLCGNRGVLFPDSNGGIQDEEITLAEALREAGYRTACVGKWHLGHQPQFLPTRHGFDSYFGIPYSNDMGSDRSIGKLRGWPPTPLLRNEQRMEQDPDQRLLTQRYTEEALAFIRAATRPENKERPFFLYLAHTMPHVPLAASDRFAGKSPRGLYGDVVEEIDWSTGQILQALRESGLAMRTLVFFTSDNGPWLAQKTAGGSAGLLREGKGSTWEGGMREPGIAWWPGHVPSGVVSTALASTLELFPTLLALAGRPLPTDRPLDGYDLSDTLLKGADSSRQAFFYYRGQELTAVRKGPWKLHFKTQAGYGQKEPDVHEPPLLFQIEHDPGERFNVAADHPDVVADLRRTAEAHRASVVVVPSQL
jgi:arylsulfatase A-like enzyme